MHKLEKCQGKYPMFFTYSIDPKDQSSLINVAF